MMGSIEVTSQRGIPAAPYYVVMRDRFLSGWGQASARTATYVAPCDSRAEAEIVAANARARGDQTHVRISLRKPRPRPHWRLGLMTRQTSARWYQPQAFCGSD